MSEFSIGVAGENDVPLWQQVVDRSRNATLFHDPRFLAYHPSDRFSFRHLVVRRDGHPVAIVPGGLQRGECEERFVSPVGASVGGPCFGEVLSLGLAVDTVAALQSFAQEQRWESISMTLPPRVYEREPNDTLGFALHHRGFRLETRQLCFTMPLRDREPETLFHKGALQRLVAARRAGLQTRIGGAELLEAFTPLFCETYERLGSNATHSIAELSYILTALPARTKLCVAFDADTPVAGLLVFFVAPNAATVFYTCSTRANSSGSRGLILAFADMIADVKAADLEYLDLGPSASTDRINEGVVVFKEGLGAQGQARDAWLWTRNS